MVEVFKTNVSRTEDAARLKIFLAGHFPGADIHFDLEDCDCVLRMEGEQIAGGRVAEMLAQMGFVCEAFD